MTRTISQPTIPTMLTVPLPTSAQAWQNQGGNGQAQPPTNAPANAATQHAANQGGQFLALIMPSDEGERQAQAMENWLQACASDDPFALELVGTRREQGFLLRASSEHS